MYDKGFVDYLLSESCSTAFWTGSHEDLIMAFPQDKAFLIRKQGLIIMMLDTTTIITSFWRCIDIDYNIQQMLLFFFT